MQYSLWANDIDTSKAIGYTETSGEDPQWKSNTE
jgi:hypothetical protein